MGGLAMVTMTTGGRSEQLDLRDSNSEQFRHCSGDTRVTFGLFACIEEGRHHRHGLVRVSPKGLLTELT